jgi:hypothetical protein
MWPLGAAGRRGLANSGELAVGLGRGRARERSRGPTGPVCGSLGARDSRLRGVRRRSVAPAAAAGNAGEGGGPPAVARWPASCGGARGGSWGPWGGAGSRREGRPRPRLGGERCLRAGRPAGALNGRSGSSSAASKQGAT